jgi:hypothetical protein
MKANPATLDPRAIVFITFIEILARWRNIHPTNARRILNEMGLKPVRLSGKTLLYRLDELEAAEKAAQNKLPPILRGTAQQKRSQKKAPPRKEAAV